MRKRIIIPIVFMLIIVMVGCSKGSGPAFEYELKDVHQVAGRQGVCTEDGYYWVSGSTTLTKAPMGICRRCL